MTTPTPTPDTQEAIAKDLQDSQDIVQCTEEDRSFLSSLKRRSYIKVKNLSKYDVYLKVNHTEDHKDFMVANTRGISASGPGFKGSVGLGSKSSTRCRSRSSVAVSYPGVLRARQGEDAKKRRIFPTVAGKNVRTSISAFIKIDKKLDYRDDIAKEEKGRLYLFENVYCGPGYVRNIKTVHVNKVREEFREGLPVKSDEPPSKKKRISGRTNKKAAKVARRGVNVTIEQKLDDEIEEFRKRYFANLHIDSPPDFDIEDAMDNVLHDNSYTSDSDYDVDDDHDDNENDRDGDSSADDSSLDDSSADDFSTIDDVTPTTRFLSLRSRNIKR